MIYYPKFLLAFILLPFFVSAQSNYKPGYIVTLKGDTLKGFIDYREWEKNPRHISFKAKAADKNATEITPGNTAAFGMTGLEYYESHIVSVSMDRLEIENISDKADPANMVTDTVFLKILTKGKYLSLYSYTDNVKSRFYLSETGNTQQPQELGYHAHYTGDLPNTIQYTRRYRTQFQYEAQKNNINGLDRMINGSRYSADDLIGLVSKINGDSSLQPISKSLFGTRWFAGVGLSYNDMSFSSDIEYPDSHSVFPKISGGIDLLTNKKVQRLYIRLEIAVTGDRHSSSNDYQQSQLKMNQLTGSFIPQIYYNFYNGDKFKVFGGGGLTINLSTYPKHYYITQQGIDFTPTRQDNFPDYYMLWESIVLKAGITLYNHIEIYAGYVPSTTITNNNFAFDGRVVSYQAGINYLFGAK